MLFEPRATFEDVVFHFHYTPPSPPFSALLSHSLANNLIGPCAVCVCVSQIMRLCARGGKKLTQFFFISHNENLVPGHQDQDTPAKGLSEKDIGNF